MLAAGGIRRANEGTQYKISRYIPDGKGGFKMKWRVGRAIAFGRCATGTDLRQYLCHPAGQRPGRRPDSSMGLFHVYSEDGLFVDTLFADGSPLRPEQGAPSAERRELQRHAISSTAGTARSTWRCPPTIPAPSSRSTTTSTARSVASATSQTPLGTVFGMHSNMGRLYLMTTDGLLVASVFQDCRMGEEASSNQLTATKGSPLGGVTMGSEWFGGHLFQAEKTGETYLIAGFTAYNLLKLDGLDKLPAIPGSQLLGRPGQQLHSAGVARPPGRAAAPAPDEHAGHRPRRDSSPPSPWTAS